MYSSCASVAIMALLAAFVASSDAVDIASIRRLDAELVNRSSSTEVKDILKASKSFLRLEKLRQMFKKSKERKDMVEFLEKFTKFSDIDSTNVTCSSNEFDILTSNNKVIDEFDRIGRIRFNSDVDRVRSVIKHFRRMGADHADTCRDKYPSIFKAKYEKLNKDALLLVTMLSSVIIEGRVFPLGRSVEYERGLPIFALYREAMSDAYTEDWFDRSLELPYVYAEVEAMARLFPDVAKGEKNLVASSEVEKTEDLFNRYAILPCEYLIDQFGRSVFWPAKLENTEPDSSIVKLTERDEAAKEIHIFYETWLKFRVCELLVKDGAKSLAQYVLGMSPAGVNDELNNDDYLYLNLEPAEFDSDDDETILVINSNH